MINQFYNMVSCYSIINWHLNLKLKSNNSNAIVFAYGQYLLGPK